MLEVIEEVSHNENLGASGRHDSLLGEDLISEIFADIKKGGTLKRGEIKDLKRILDVQEDFTVSTTRVTQVCGNGTDSEIESIESFFVEEPSKAETAPYLDLRKNSHEATSSESSESSGSEDLPEKPEIPVKSETTITKVRRFRRSKTEYIVIKDDGDLTQEEMKGIFSIFVFL